MSKYPKNRKSKHGLWGIKEYWVWAVMKDRCNNEKNKSFKNYGGRGIKVCERWNDFRAFIVDMGECPPKLTLERIDNNGDYTPENCRWATRREQTANRRDTVWIDYECDRLPLSTFCRLTGIRYKVAWHLMDKGILRRAAS